MSIFQRLWDGFGFGESDESDYEYEYVEEESSEQADWQPGAPNSKPASATNVIGMASRGAGYTEMVVVEPRSFEDIPQVVTALKQRKTVILNLGLLDADSAQRCVDFVAGGAFAMDGHQERIGETIFLFTPGFVQISNYPSSERPLESAPGIPQPTAVPQSAWSIEQTRLVQ
ncbi:cell division protein SepF [Oscillatoria sp. FACHB-1407]|uniref:cell division protein SepF n=1 Tax=Oscillatoria sp. FACHB-1407 TaxID=2692847 RepID=UPI001687BEFA|nr:cell division protein SepF [Oscillatoria sp. FACHB-1407]MBD2460713.1 cell division protein SepF [Oscillatoria sp. FACHB-1407]